MIVKTGDIYAVNFTLGGIDLTGATVRLLARGSDDVVTELAASVANATGGVITHTLTGDLAAGAYDVEAEVSVGGQIISFPTPQDGGELFFTMHVVPDLG